VILLIDENVAVAVVDYFRQRGHQVFMLTRDVLARGVPDLAIAASGDEVGAIVVTHDKDFTLLVARVPIGRRQRFRHLGRISLFCKETRARRRVERLIESIEFEYDLAQRQRDRRLIFEIAETSFRVVR